MREKKSHVRRGTAEVTSGSRKNKTGAMRRPLLDGLNLRSAAEGITALILEIAAAEIAHDRPQEFPNNGRDPFRFGGRII